MRTLKSETARNRPLSQWTKQLMWLTFCTFSGSLQWTDAEFFTPAQRAGEQWKRTTNARTIMRLLPMPMTKNATHFLRVQQLPFNYSHWCLKRVHKQRRHSVDVQCTASSPSKKAIAYPLQSFKVDKHDTWNEKHIGHPNSYYHQQENVCVLYSHSIGMLGRISILARLTNLILT